MKKMSLDIKIGIAWTIAATLVTYGLLLFGDWDESTKEAIHSWGEIAIIAPILFLVPGKLLLVRKRR